MTGGLDRLAAGLLRLAPAPWRERYRDEVLAQFSESDRTVRDAADIALVSLGLRIHHIGGNRHMTKIALAMLSLGILWTAWAVARLADGVIELPGHWWSAPGPTLMVGGVAILVLSWRRHRRPV